MKLTEEQKDKKKRLDLIKKEADSLEQSKRDTLLVIVGSGIKHHLGQLRDDESRLGFLTEIFNLTEDFRYDISTSDATKEAMSTNAAMVVPCGTVAREEDDCVRKERSDEATV